MSVWNVRPLKYSALVSLGLVRRSICESHAKNRTKIGQWILERFSDEI